MSKAFLFPRPLQRETEFSGRPVLVIYPEDTDSRILGEVVSRLEQWDGQVMCRKHDDAEALNSTECSIITWGNLSNNAIVRGFYFKFLLVTDCHYPGPGGYELRTLLDPFGNGNNVIHLGYSDEQGFQRGWKRLMLSLAPTTPLLQEVDVRQLPMTSRMVEQIKGAPLPEHDWMIPKDRYVMLKGYLGYLLHDEQLLREYEEAWICMLRYGIPDGDHLIKDLHLRESVLMVSFQLLECAGMLSESLRGQILNQFLVWTKSDQGVARLEDPNYTTPGLPRQNHGTIPALALAYLVNYFRSYFPDYPEIEKWHQLSERVFEPYRGGSWKPASEGLAHGWWLELPILLDYGLLDPEHKFFENGGARRMADCALAVVNNNGWMPASGDSHIFRSFPGDPLRIAYAWYRDPRYRYVEQMAPEERRMQTHIFLPRSFDMGGNHTGEKPAAGLHYVPLDPLVYNGAKKKMEIHSWPMQVEPSGPLESCFDKIGFRSGWKSVDPYFLIDGIGGGSHAYEDTLDILEYSINGYSFIVSESGPKFPEPDSHSIVTIARNGECQPIPCFAECINREWNAVQKHGYLCLQTRHNNGATWTREVFFLNRLGLVIHDNIEAEEEGDFSIQSNLRIPGKVTQHDGQLIAERDAGNLIYSLTTIAPDLAVSEVVEQDKSIQYRLDPGVSHVPPEDDMVLAWQKRYGVEELVVSISRCRMHAHLAKGESVSFFHYAQSSSRSEKQNQMKVEGDCIKITGPKDPVLLRSKAPQDAAPKPRDLTEQAAGATDCSEPVCLRWVEHPAAEVGKLIPIPGQGILALLETGKVRFYHPDGSIIWDQFLGTPLHDADYDADSIYISYGGDKLAAFSFIGMKKWEIVIERIPSSCPWWEWSTPAAFTVKSLDRGRDRGVVIGCGDLHLKYVSSQGELMWVFRYVNGIPATLRVLTKAVHGMDAILAGGEVLSNRADCRVVDYEGKQIQDIPVEWWTSRMTVLACGQSRDPSLFVFGVNRAKNIHFLELTESVIEAPLNKKWVKRIPGVVNDIVFDGRDPVFHVGSSLGLVTTFSFSGEIIDRHYFSTGICRLFSMGNRTLIGFSDGTAAFLINGGRRGGQCSSLVKLNLKWPAACLHDGAVFAPSHKGGIFKIG